MTLSPRRSLSDDCIPSWIVLGDLSAVGKYYFCNTCYIHVSCWKFSSSFGLMPCYIFHSLFSSVTKPVWFPVLWLYRATAPINVVFLIFSILVLSDVVSSLLLAYKLHCWLFMVSCTLNWVIAFTSTWSGSKRRLWQLVVPGICDCLVLY